MANLMLTFLLLIHGLIHLTGYVKSVRPESVPQLMSAISKPEGILWALCAGLFTLSASAVWIMKDKWWMIAMAAVALSQTLIFLNWSDAKFGSLANMVILAAVMAGYAGNKFYREYCTDWEKAVEQTSTPAMRTLTEQDISVLPEAVQRYMRFCGVVGKEVPVNMRVEMAGEMRSRKKDWFGFHSEQVNTFSRASRQFFMRGRMYGMDVPGYHRFAQGKATMDIRLLSLFRVVHNEGREMDEAETVTFFNDMCIMAPASLTDARIIWGDSGNDFADAQFTDNGITISARLVFGEDGRLVNFFSDDRFDMSQGAPLKMTFSTPVKEYSEVNGIRIFSSGEAVWHYPEGEFVYGRFYLKKIEYNIGK